MIESRLLRGKLWRGLLAVVIAVVMVSQFAVGISYANAGQVTGAIYTTTAGCTDVNQNHYASKADVYLSGGPLGQGNPNLSPDGEWYWQITNTSGNTVLSTQPLSERKVMVTGGQVVAYTGGAVGHGTSPCDGGRMSVWVGPFDDSANGQYKLWMSPVEGFNDFHPSRSKTDNFSVEPEGNQPDPATLTLVKLVAGDKGPLSPEDFTLSISGDDVSMDVETGAATELPPGTYTIAEETEENYTPSGWQCGNENGPPPDDAGKATREITLEPGDEVTCTIINTYAKPKPDYGNGSIKIVKKAPGALPKSDKFTFDTFRGKKTVSGSNGLFTLDKLKAGTYTISERSRKGWFLTGLKCVGGQQSTITTSIDDRAVTIDLAAGENIKCTFTNERAGGLTIVKKAPGATKQDTFTFDVPGGTRTVSGKLEWFTLTNLKPGTTVNVAEQVPAGWDVAASFCKGKGASAENGVITYNVKAGKTAVCTVINKKDDGDPGNGDPTRSVTIHKVITGDEDPNLPEKFSFTVYVDGVEHSTVDVAPGESATIADLPIDAVIVVEENPLPGGWSFVSAVCEPIESEYPTVALTAAAIQVQAPPSATVDEGDEAVACVFTNRFERERGDDDPDTPPPPPPPQDEGTDTETEVPPPDPETPPTGSDDVIPDAPAAAPDLPVTGGNYVWYLLAGAAMAGTGGAQLLRRRLPRRPE